MVIGKKKNGVSSSIQIKRQNAVRIAPKAWGSEKQVSKNDLYAKIADRAYFLYLERGGQDGNDLADWLKAERLVRSGR